MGDGVNFYDQFEGLDAVLKGKSLQWDVGNFCDRICIISPLI